ncbi:MAG: prephenate dehydrogenase [Candidatus Omnitrophica bacterium]|nr:prephenate dehydrogenase [Candidatus Omnitrophota bacterium]
MPLFNKVAVIGSGLIGGSIALAIKKNKLAKEIVGVSLHQESLKLALKRRAIDKGSLSLGIIAGADLIILATPVDVIINSKNKISKIIDRNCIVIDVGSTKEKIVASLEKIFPNYVGTHPLAGSEKRGIVHAHSGMFKGSLCILTPTKITPKSTLERVRSLWVRLGAKVVLLSPREHDKVLAFTSHLPHIVAFALIGSVPNNSLKFAASGLKGTTRIAASNALLWLDVFLSNKKNLLKALAIFESNLSQLKEAIRKNDEQALKRILDKSRNKREQLK